MASSILAREKPKSDKSPAQCILSIRPRCVLDRHYEGINDSAGVPHIADCVIGADTQYSQRPKCRQGGEGGRNVHLLYSQMTVRWHIRAVSLIQDALAMTYVTEYARLEMTAQQWNEGAVLRGQSFFRLKSGRVLVVESPRSSGDGG